MNKLYGHFKTITKHKLLVTRLCMRCGLYKQGLLHDISKYSWVEFHAGVTYFQGNRSPIDKEKEVLGYSLGWLHHKGRNRHHWEYWLDNSKDGIKPIRMPVCFIIEMFCDRVAASKIYYKKAYNDDIPLQYFMNGYDYVIMEQASKDLIQHLLTYLSQNGLDETIRYIKDTVLKEGYAILL